MTAEYDKLKALINSTFRRQTEDEERAKLESAVQKKQELAKSLPQKAADHEIELARHQAERDLPDLKSNLKRFASEININFFNGKGEVSGWTKHVERFEKYHFEGGQYITPSDESAHITGGRKVIDGYDIFEKEMLSLNVKLPSKSIGLFEMNFTLKDFNIEGEVRGDMFFEPYKPSAFLKPSKLFIDPLPRIIDTSLVRRKPFEIVDETKSNLLGLFSQLNKAIESFQSNPS
jgi:hypothetical protein